MVEKVDLTGVNVLVVEDHEDTRDLLHFWLTRLGSVVRTASGGLEGIALLQTGPPPDVIVCDLHMPRMDGCTFVEQLHERGLGHIPVIALTGSASDAALMRTFAAGFRAHLIKPVTADAVARQVQRVLQA